MEGVVADRSSMEGDAAVDKAPASNRDDGGDAGASTIPNPSWFTPIRLLVVFCIINLLNYVDRGTIASNGVNGSPIACTGDGTCTSGSGIQGNFKLSFFKDGVLSSAFMVGLLIASPIFASLARSHNPFRLIGVGLSVWTLATAGCGFSIDFWSISICRMFVGVGEASFISLAAPYIDDNAPPSQKTAWLAIFYMCIPAGFAFGYIYGGLVGGHFNWRYAFWGEAFLMLPFAILGFAIKPLRLKGFPSSMSVDNLKTEPQAQQEVNGEADAGYSEPCEPTSQENSTSRTDKRSRIWRDFNALLVNEVYVFNVLGYIAYNFVIGAYSYWGPKAGFAIYDMKNADMVFGGITIFSGIFGTLFGGFFLDRIQSTISNAFKLLSGATLLGAIFCFTAFCMKRLYIFLALFAIGQLLVFATQAPVNYVCLHCVKPSLRALSMAMSTVAIHIFGDVPSSPLVGVLQDHINNWRETALILTSILFVAAGFWCIGIFFRNIDRSDEDCENNIPPKNRSNRRPLLEGNTANTDQI